MPTVTGSHIPSHRKAWEKLCKIAHFDSKREDPIYAQAREDLYSFYTELSFRKRKQFLKSIEQLSCSESFVTALRANSRCPVFANSFYKAIIKGYQPEKDSVATKLARELTKSLHIFPVIGLDGSRAQYLYLS
jgi:hypothetical protein